jgi:hypothetical protein
MLAMPRSPQLQEDATKKPDILSPALINFEVIHLPRIAAPS